jgi:peptidoglycan/LPS O-acetylase OafA/YrhL
VALGFLYWATYRTGWAHRPQDIWLVLALYALMFVLAFDRGFLAHAFATRPLLKLGEWSYGIYMGQTFFLQLIRTFEQRAYPPPDTIVFDQRFGDLIWWIEPFALLLVCIGWGALLAIFIEHPANTALRRMLALRKPGRT